MTAVVTCGHDGAVLDHCTAWAPGGRFRVCAACDATLALDHDTPLQRLATMPAVGFRAGGMLALECWRVTRRALVAPPRSV